MSQAPSLSRVKSIERVKSYTSDKVSKLPIPHDVDRKLYLSFWFVFGCAALAYFVYVAIKCSTSYKSPGATIEVDPNQPLLPVYSVCFETGFTDYDYFSGSYDNWTAGTGLALNELPVLIAYWNFSFDPLYGYERWRYFTDESQTYCNYGCDCIQFNMYNEINANKGKVSIYASGNYNLSADRSVSYLFVRAQELGRFTNGTSGENYDNLNLPTGTHVDASWTVSKRLTTTKWVPYTQDTTISYGMTQQVEPLTKTATQALLKGLADQKALSVCENHQPNANCTVNNVKGFCNNNQICSWNCTDNSETIPIGWICDGYYDCDDGSDEICPKFNCSDGKQSIPVESTCNGVADCKDGSDEADCPTLPITVSVNVAPYAPEVTIVQSTVTFGWDVALAAFKSVLELAFAAMSFLFPAYFLSEPELRRFILRRGEAPKTEAPLSPGSPVGSPEPFSSHEKETVEMKPLQQGDNDQHD